MELSEEQLNKIYDRNDELGDFLLDGADAILSDGMDPMMFEIDDLPDQDIIDLVDWWKKKQSEQKYTVKVLRDYGAFLNKTPNGSFYFGTLSTADAYGDQNGFTQAEIEKLKHRDDLAIDWDKAVIEPIGDDDDD